ncbi:uncharacterized protein [Epargyreus clarus]|uniref:uncharacterized protein n=1 Tax=Epargyreus clarus TaxID=520877 RepID=UPI003C2D7B66
MLKFIIILAMLIVCCYCIDSNESLTEETRASKKKKSSARIIGLILLFILSKVAVFKAVSMYLLMAFFQKLFYIGGILLKYILKNRMEKPSPVYGPPQDYNTVGYSYGPPHTDHEPLHHQEAGYPGADLAGSFDWLLNKNVK